MAKKQAAPKTVLERVYNVPLRREFLKAPWWKRTPKAVKALKGFMVKHMKSEDINIGRYANQYLWSKGIKSPPHHIKVSAVKDDKGRVSVELVDLSAKAKRELKNLEDRKKSKDDKKKKEADAKPDDKKEVATKKDDKKVVDAEVKEVKEEVKVDEKKEVKAEPAKTKSEEPKKTETKKDDVPKAADLKKEVSKIESVDKKEDKK